MRPQSFLRSAKYLPSQWPTLLFALLRRPLCLVLPRTLIGLWIPRPHSLAFPLCLGLCSLISFFETPKLGAALGFVYGGQSTLDHLQSDIPAEEKPADVDSSNDPLVLVCLVDVCAHISVQNVASEPLQGFGRVRLCWLSKVRSLWRINRSNADRNL